MTEQPGDQDLAQISAAIRRKDLSVREVTQAALERAARWQPALNCFIAIDAETALRRAAALDAEIAAGRWRGPLHGVPLAHKDMFYRTGQVSTCGSKIRRGWRAETTATVLERLDAAGAVEIGRLNMSEFAAGPTGHNPHFGDCRNPWNPAHIPGGSSSGSGAAVAARIVSGALGSDTGGSIRVPAAANGVVGLKPTYGAVSRAGAMPRAWSLDCVGPIARTAADCALLFQAISGPDTRDPTTDRAPTNPAGSAPRQDLRGVTIGTAALDDVDAEIAAALANATKDLQALGARLTPVKLPDLTAYYRVADTISKCEAATMHEKWLRTRPGDYGDHTRTRIEAGRSVPAVRYLEALNLRAPMLREILDGPMAGIDALLLPAIPIPVPRLDETDLEGTDAHVLAQVAQLTRFTRPFNLVGLPALSVPCGFTRSGLPIGFQLVGFPFSEPHLLTLADAYQQATDHHRRAPTL